MQYVPSVGERVELVSMTDDPDPIAPGSAGTVYLVTELKFGSSPEWQVHVKWDSGRTLSCIVPPDVLRRASTESP